MVIPPGFSTLNPVQSYDFSQAYGYSNLDTSRFEIGTDATFRFTPRFYMTGAYRYLEYNDDEPVLVDSTGSIDLYSLGLGWKF